jgi:hypothetical protein
MKNNTLTLTDNDIIGKLKEARDFIFFYANRYRFDPFMSKEYNEQLENINKIIESMERENEWQETRRM